MNSSKTTYRPRFAVYTHDTFGLGHVRRCLHIIKQLSKEMPNVAILLVTGSPALHYLKDLPPNVDIVKIPTIVKTGAKGSLPSHIPLGYSELTELRSRIIKETILAFQPEVFLVDNFPLGANSELLPTLKELRSGYTKTILGLRDILDGPLKVRTEWKKQGVYDALDRYYDKILIYGVRDIFDAIQEYHIPLEIQDKVKFCGYLTATDPVPKLSEDIREKYGVKGPLILVTGGGGGDAFPLLNTLIESLDRLPKSHALIFTGPLMGEADRETLKKKIYGKKNVVIEDFVRDLRPYLKEADILVSMCGYNIAAEIVYHRTNAVIAPRTWRFGEHANRKQTKEEKEQIMRGEMLEKYGLVRLLEPDDLTPEALAEKISLALAQPMNKAKKNSLAVEGLKNAISQIKEYF